MGINRFLRLSKRTTMTPKEAALCQEALVRMARERAHERHMAAGWDAGNKSMKAGGRKKWNEEDFAAARQAFVGLAGEDDS